jgi:outer membrane lipopolysaccharide assembly protein LptE/RlpB
MKFNLLMCVVVILFTAGCTFPLRGTCEMEQKRKPKCGEIEWTKEAIEAALACMYSPKTTKTQKVNYINMRDALNAAWREQWTAEHSSKLSS